MLAPGLGEAVRQFSLCQHCLLYWSKEQRATLFPCKLRLAGTQSSSDRPALSVSLTQEHTWVAQLPTAAAPALPGPASGYCKSRLQEENTAAESLTALTLAQTAPDIFPHTAWMRPCTSCFTTETRLHRIPDSVKPGTLTECISSLTYWRYPQSSGVNHPRLTWKLQEVIFPMTFGSWGKR